MEKDSDTTVTIPLLDADGRTVATLELSACAAGTLMALTEEQRVEQDAFGTCEYERVQLLEGNRYSYELVGGPQGALLGPASCVFRHSNPRFGSIEPGNYTGLLPLQLCRGDADAAVVASAVVEVQSAKAGSLRHYRHMLSDIAKECVALIMQLQTPARGVFESNAAADAETLTQRFYFLKSLLDGRDFNDALQRILRSPHVRSAGLVVEKDLRRGGFRMGPREMRQVVSRTPRQPLPEGHPLRDRLPALASVPERVTTTEHCDVTDTAENRFVKYALGVFSWTLNGMAERLEALSGPNTAGACLCREMRGLEARLEEYLAHGFFRAVSPPAMLPLGSPVLQRRDGYRQVLHAWLLFDLAARIIWRTAPDAYRAGQRDVAALYEYWLFFKLLGVVEEVFAMDGGFGADGHGLIVPTADGFDLTLAAGKQLTCHGVFPRDSEAVLRVSFAYNRVFPGTTPGGAAGQARSYPGRGSWTRAMRPDYTITLWPSELSEDEAEKREQIVHLHFDAKYRIVNPALAEGSPGRIAELFGDAAARDGGARIQDVMGEDDGARAIAEQEQAERVGVASKRADLLKMHAYRDAIRRTEGAYILYPGSPDQECRWGGYHELLPGIGAFPVCPGSGDDMANVREFLRQAAELCVDRFSQMHRRRYWTHEAVREAPTPRASAYPPAHETPPDDLLVTVGFVPPELQQAVRERRVFFFHAMYPDGHAAEVDPRELRGRYLAPYCDRGPIGWYAEVTSCRLERRETVEELIGKDAMAARDVRHHPAHRPSHYYVLRLGAVYEGLPVEPERWRGLIAARAPGGAPFAATWGELWTG